MGQAIRFWGSAAPCRRRRIFHYDRSLDILPLISRPFFANNFVPRMCNGRFIDWESTANLTGQNPMGDSVIFAFDRRHDN